MLSQPIIYGESLRFDLKLTDSGRYRVFRSTDLINWKSVEDIEASSGIHQLKYSLFGSTCFFQVQQSTDED